MPSESVAVFTVISGKKKKSLITSTKQPQQKKNGKTWEPFERSRSDKVNRVQVRMSRRESEADQ